MPEPEIARRCPICGASIREVALFCPQCGNALPPRRSDQSTVPIAPLADEVTQKDTAPLENSEIESRRQSFADTMAIQRPESAAEPRPPDVLMSDTLVIERPQESREGAAPRVRGGVGAKLERATTLARDVEGDVIQRVQKVREISSVVIDEAGYDPSLRFVLVAVIVFFLFLVIVLLNKLIS
jgi:hypothetical protein